MAAVDVAEERWVDVVPEQLLEARVEGAHHLDGHCGHVVLLVGSDVVGVLGWLGQGLLVVRHPVGPSLRVTVALCDVPDSSVQWTVTRSPG